MAAFSCEMKFPTGNFTREWPGVFGKVWAGPDKKGMALLTLSAGKVGFPDARG
jgi:hypothetical protein